MQFTLSACSVALAAGRYRWQQDQVLAVVMDMVQQEVMGSRKMGVEKEQEARGREVVFVKEGQVVRGGRRRRWKARSLPKACDWQVVADLNPQMVFPEEIDVTRLWPDIVIWSGSQPPEYIVMVVGIDGRI